MPNAAQVHGKAWRQMSVTAQSLDAMPRRRRSTTAIIPNTTETAAIWTMSMAENPKIACETNSATGVDSSQCRNGMGCTYQPPRLVHRDERSSADEVRYPPPAPGERHPEPENERRGRGEAHHSAGARSFLP